MKKSILDITNDIDKVLASLEESQDEVVSYALAEQLNELVTAQAEKVDNAASYIKYSDKKIEWLKDEKKRIDAEIKRIERNVNWIKFKILNVMELENVNKLTGLKGHFFTKRISQSVVINDPAKLDGKYLVSQVIETPDKNLIKEDLKKGVEVKGAALVSKDGLLIK